MTPDQLPMRPITDAEWPAYWRTILHAFHDDWHDDSAAYERNVFELGRSLAVLDGDEPVATTGIFTRELTVPGTVLSAAHVTMVSVRQTYRRQGLLRRMMHRQLADIAAGDEPIAVLWASEEAIYGRYGYGAASYAQSISADTRELRLLTAFPAGRLRLATPGEVVEDLSRVYETTRAVRPGTSSRLGAAAGDWWTQRLTDLERHRKGATERRCVLYEIDGTVTGYALYRTKGEWDAKGPNGEVIVEELMCEDPAARMALWRFLFDLDLSRKLSAWNLPVDDPLFQLVDAPRRLGRTHNAALYLRVVDLPAALAARRYATPVDLVLEVSDTLLPDNAGRWRLTGDTEKASCERTTDTPDLSLGIRELGAVYLGGTALGALAAAGLVTETRPGAVAEASAGFGWHVAPYAPEVF